MSRASVVRCWAAVTGAVVAGAMVMVIPAQAQVRSTSPAAADLPMPAVAHVLDTTDVEQYWTADRMEQALPLGLDEVGNLLTSPGPASPPVAARTALTAPRSVGKLFFSDGTSDFVCSAATVNTAEKNVLITAAHCAHSGASKPCGLLGLDTCPGAYFTNFLFVPRFANGSAPDGRWVGTRAIVPQQWMDTENLDFDQALIEVAPRSGRQLVSVVGGNALAWNYPPRENEVRVWGWPAEAPYDGETVQRCTGSTSDLDGSGDAFLACPMNGGASGGPWFLSMANANVGWIWAVTSRRTTRGPAHLLAHPLTAAVKTLLSAAGANRTTPVASGRVVARAGLSVRAVPAQVGRGQILRLVARAGAGRRVVLQVRYTPKGVWRRVGAKRADSSGIAEFRHRPQRVGNRWYRVRTTTATSRAIRVRVHRCPLPVDRSAAVVDATACTAPVG